MDTVKILSLVGAFAAVAAVGSCAVGNYTMAQHDRKVLAAFRTEVLQDPTPHLITVEADGVERQGFLNKGAAFNNSGDSKSYASALIVASNPESACWYTTLRVTNGTENLPFLEKIGGGELEEVYFANQAFNNYKCLPTPDAKTIENFPKSTGPG